MSTESTSRSIIVDSSSYKLTNPNFYREKKGSGAMSGTKLTPNRALANARLGTIKVITQFGCHPQLGFLTPDSET